MRQLKGVIDRNSREMIRSVGTARLWYLAGAIVFALVAVALTRARGDLLNPWFLIGVLTPTLAVSTIASLFLISTSRIANVTLWILAGVFVPLGSVVGYFVPIFLMSPTGLGEFEVFVLVATSIITAPVGVCGHLLLRWLINRRFYFPSLKSGNAIA
jgi:hypothetical protein